MRFAAHPAYIVSMASELATIIGFISVALTAIGSLTYVYIWRRKQQTYSPIRRHAKGIPDYGQVASAQTAPTLSTSPLPRQRVSTVAQLRQVERVWASPSKPAASARSQTRATDTGDIYCQVTTDLNDKNLENPTGSRSSFSAQVPAVSGPRNRARSSRLRRGDPSLSA
jgi:hypothetical protein